MRVLQVAPPWFPVPPNGYGGIEQVVAALTDGLAASGYHVTLLAAGGSRTRAQRLWVSMPEPQSEHLGDPVIEVAHVLDAYARRGEFDLIHDHTVIGTALGAMPGGPPVLHTLHGPWNERSSLLYTRLAERVHLAAISHDQAARAPEGMRLAGVVHNAIDVSSYRFQADKGDHLVFLGRASPEKGPEIAIDIAARLGRPLRMAMKVNEPAEHAYYTEMIEPRLGTADVEFVDVATPDEKAALLADAAVVLFPICWPEPFGLVPVEANACGTPVVAFAEGAAGEVIADGSTGLLVEPGDLDSFERAVEEATELDPAVCRKHVEQSFDTPIMVEAYAQLYEDILASDRSRRLGRWDDRTMHLARP